MPLPTNLQAPVIQCGDAFARYCFQCAKVEPLDNFDGHKRCGWD
jgi:hypothetical protein